MKIAVNDAHLKTAIVEIKSLVVSGKQVTLAVFRQIQQEGWDTTSPVWGRVNYCPDKMCKSLYRPFSHSTYQAKGPCPHVHIIWQKGSELRRDLWVQPPATPWLSKDEPEDKRAEIRASHAHYVRLWNHLVATPQLFIAV